LKKIAVRLKRYSDSEEAFRPNDKHAHARRLIDSNIEKRDPALRNLTDGLFERGLAPIVDGCRLYWFLVDDDNSIEYYLGKNEVECVFDAQWFEQQKKRIRYYQGIRYVDECAKLADQFLIKPQDRKIDYVIERQKQA